MDSELGSILERASELLRDLETEYNNCLKTKNVSERARNITDEFLAKLRVGLDHTMTRLWEKHIAPNLSTKEKENTRIYFPITKDLNSFHSLLGRGQMSQLDKTDRKLYDFLLSKQTFQSKENEWLRLLTDIAAEGKHTRLTPQKRTEIRRTKVSGPFGHVSWDPNSVKFGAGVQIMGAPIDPRTQHIIPTQNVTEEIETWVSFIFED